MSECDIWTGRINPGGYPTLGSGKLAHRAAYELANPDENIVGKDVHHLCGTRACHRADHLQAMEPSEHRKMHASVRREAQTHCVNGHEWTDGNTDMVMDADGYTCRRCRTCRLKVQSAYRAKNYVKPVEKARVSQCVNGHEYTEENSAYKNGDKKRRYCKTCNRIRVRANYQKLKNRASLG